MAEGSKKKFGSLHSGIRTRKSSSQSSNKLHPRDVMLIRRLKVFGLSDYQIWKEYRIPLPVIQKANKEIERQATEEFENKEQHAVELEKFKARLKFIIDSADLMANDKNLSHADRLDAERIKLDSLAMLQVATEASITSPDPRIALKKIVERSNNRR